MTPQEGEFALFAEGFGDDPQTFGILEQGGHRGLHRMTDHILNAFAQQALQSGGVVQVFAVFHHFHDVHLQSGRYGLFGIFHRTAAESRRMDEHGHLGHAAFIVFHHVLGKADHLVRVGDDGQKNIVGVVQVALMKGGRDHRYLFFLEIPLQGQGASGGIIEIEHDAGIQEILEVAFGDIGLVLVVADHAVDGVVAQHLGVVDITEIVFHTLGIGVAGIRSGAGDGQRQAQLIDLGLGRSPQR